LKKFFGIALSLALFCTVQVGSVFAETPLSQAVNDGMGAPYKYAGTTKGGFDCSGYTSFVFAKFDVALPHTSAGQAKLGTTVAQDQLQPGDLVFFDTGGGGISHVGIYVGDGKFYHSATNQGVTVSKLSEAYYAKRYVTAKRILSEDQFNNVMADNS
jgi:cell wall-associated NlpC family hydrolase